MDRSQKPLSPTPSGSLSIHAPLVMAVPKGRILKELSPMFDHLGVLPEAGFFDEQDRRLQFSTNHPMVSIIRVRSFDVPSFVAHGAAHIGISGSDVLHEFDYPELYAPIDLGIGRCRLSLAAMANHQNAGNFAADSHVRVATKYPNLTARYFASLGVQAECIKLSGAMELAPLLGLAPYIVDLVSTGHTLKANGLKEIAPVLDGISSRLIVNRTILKTRAAEMRSLLHRIRHHLNHEARQCA